MMNGTMTQVTAAGVTEAGQPKSWSRIHAASDTAMTKLANQAILLQTIGMWLSSQAIS
jgi:hypothetical protein